MEPAETPLADEVRYSIFTTVVNIQWRNHPDGWFVQFEGSRESLNFGIDRPLWDVGDTVHITFKRITIDAIPR